MPAETTNLAQLDARGPMDGAEERIPTRQDLLDEIQRLRATVAQQDNRIACIQEIGLAHSNTHSLDELLQTIMERITVLMDADRSTLFLINAETGMLWSKVIQGDQVNEIQLQIGEGIAGWVALTGRSMNVRDAYAEERFNAEVDLRTGYQTRSILCQPVRNKDRKTIGVVQVLNKRQGVFTAEDEALLSAISAQVAVALENSILYLRMLDSNLELTETKEQLEKKIAEVDLLYDIQREISQAVDLPDLIQLAARKALDTVHADLCAVAIREREHLRCFVIQREKLISPAARTWEMLEFDPNAPMPVPDPALRTLTDNDGFEELHAPLGEGISGMVIESGVPYLSNNPDPPQTLLRRLRRPPRVPIRHVIAVPFFVEDRCIGALKLINKRPSSDHRGPAELDITDLKLLGRRPAYASDHDIDGFDDDDLKLLTLVAGQLAGPVAASLFRERQEKANRLATIGQMLSGVIHDFKTPVTIISGYVQLMARQDDAKVRREYAESVLKQFDQLNKMTKEILAFARGESTILLRRVFVHKLADELEELLGRELREKGIDFTIQADYRGAVKMDDVKIKRAVFNLARNAMEAMPNGGRFTITLSREGDNAVFQFADTGPGIPPEIRATLFESFVTQGKQGGTGLGLAIVKKIVEEHSGTIDFVSDERGTTFTIRIPIGQDVS